jgi:hypothetical protein
MADDELNVSSCLGQLLFPFMQIGIVSQFLPFGTIGDDEFLELLRRVGHGSTAQLI